MPEGVVTPRLAASLILLRESLEGLEVMMVERAGSASYAAGAFVFPGGRVDETDGSLAGSSAADAALRVAAIRETYEECGLLLLEEAEVPPRTLAGPGRSELATPTGPASSPAAASDFAAWVLDNGIRLATDVLIPFAHWITPPHMPKRFDTFFYVAPAPRDQVAVADQREVMSAAWVRPGALVAAAEAAEINLMFATYMNLRWLARHDGLAAALSAARQRDIATVIPEPVKGPDGQVFRIPAAAGYGEAEVLERRFRQV